MSENIQNDKAKDTRTFAEKHPKLNLLIGFVLLIALVALAIIAIYYIGKYVALGITKASTWLKSLASSLDAVIIVALITGAVSIVASVISKVIEYKQKRQEYLYQKREEPYSEFIDMVYKLQERSKKNEPYPEEEMLADMYKFSKKLTLWGSNRVIKKWLAFRKNSVDGKDVKNIAFVMEDIMFAMRKDMGLSKMKKGNLLGFFINDIDNYKKMVSKK